MPTGLTYEFVYCVLLSFGAIFKVEQREQPVIGVLGTDDIFKIIRMNVSFIVMQRQSLMCVPPMLPTWKISKNPNFEVSLQNCFCDIGA